MKVSQFSLVKWYMDCVTEAGDVAILYCADLRWRGIHTTYSSVLTTNVNLVETSSSMSRYQLVQSDSKIQIEFPRLKVTGSWMTDSVPVQQTVYENASGAVAWNCLQPRSLVNLRVGEREFTGLGYAECLTLTLPPWQLPMRKLRWGRFVSQDQSIAWIDWQGDYSTSFAVYNGGKCETLSITDSEIAIPGVTLHMVESFSLRAGRLGSTILPATPSLGKLLPRSLFNIDEQKWRSRGILNTPKHNNIGWVIHEVVHWKV